MINACIYNRNGNLQGCITEKVLEQFEESFDAIVKKSKQLNLFESVISILVVMRETLIQSNQHISADYLNCLKLISKKHRYELPLELSQFISRNYHDLLKYCCSNNVEDDVFNKTINYLRECGIVYQGKKIQGVNDDECAFEYNGITIGIKMVNKSDLFSLWNKKENEYKAVILFGDKICIVTEKTFSVLVLAIKACIDDYKQENIDLIELSNELISIAKKLMSGGIQ